METTYNPQSIEQKWYQTWENRGYFAPGSKPDAANYCIMIPPPNVTGTLHMGHAFQDTIMDALTRYHRMKGENTLWQAGTDHAGIATQMVVERQLAAEGKTRHDLGREAFIDRVWDWKEQSGGTITQQLRRMGGSLDWQNERFTMDDGLSDAVHKVFIQLYDEGLIYRGKRLVNWDPVLHTALSDLEVLSEEESGHFWQLRYPLSDGSGHLVVATTRPETMLGDTAVAVHPEDERFKHLIGKTITLPLVGREIPIIADDYVDMDLGTGCVKITPAHDFNDYEMGTRHNLPMINIFTVDACINDESPEKYRGFDRYEARDMIIHDLKELDLLESIKDHKLMVPRGDRSGSVVEPYLTDQWYVKIAPLAKPAIDAVKNGDIKFIPENWDKTYFEWMNNIQDWCISRQIWWGHRIPAWYDEAGNIYVADNEAAARKKYKLAKNLHLTQDNDVLDTWFSSALWPFSTLGWPEKTDRLKQFYPTSVLVTGFDIIFFWVARMIMFGLKFMDDVPFKEIYIHGLVRDSDGQKMSKSKGNVLDPIDIIDGIDLESLVTKRTTGLMQPKMAAKIEKSTRKQFPDGISAYGTDALRFTFASQATTGRDVVLSVERIAGNRNFCNKIWNATRYVLMNTENQDNGINNTHCEYSLADRWIRSRLQLIIGNVERHFATYRFDLAAQELYAFVWDDYCDWYLELSKPVLLKDNFSEAEKRGTRQTLVQVLETILRLNHPVMPFITEELWQQVAPLAGIETDSNNDTIMNRPFPVAASDIIDKKAEEELEWMQTFIMGIRRIRSESDISPGKPLPVILQNASESDKSRYQNNESFIMTLAKLDSVSFMGNDETAPESSTALVGEMKILIPLAGLIDKDAELTRLDKEIGKLQTNLEKSAARLDSPGFADKAPEAVVNKERERVAEMQSAILKLNEQLVKIRAL